MNRILLILLGVLAASCSLPAQTCNGLVISGFVSDSTSHDRIGGAAVSAVGETACDTARTDDRGYFKLSLLRNIEKGADIRIEVEKQGYKHYDEHMTVSIEHPLDIFLEPLSVAHPKSALRVQVAPSKAVPSPTPLPAKPQELSETPFAFAVETMIMSSGSGDFIGFWLPARDEQGCSIEPIDDLLFLRVTNNGPGSRMIVNYSLETKQKDGWSLMTKKEVGPSGYLFFTLQSNAVPAVGFPIPFKANGTSNKYPILSWTYGGANVKQAGVVQVQTFDLVAGSQNLTQGQSVRGWSAFQHQGLPEGDLRMNITDELGNIYTISQTITKPGPSNDITQHPIKIQSLTDVSGCRQKADF